MPRTYAYTEEFLLKKLTEAANILGSELSLATFKKLNGFPSISVYQQRFGSWSKALALIGITKFKSNKRNNGNFGGGPHTVKGSPEAFAWGKKIQLSRKIKPNNEKLRFAKHRIRFEILHRDKFTCQYCGRTPQDGAKLVVDHMDPYVNGGLTNKDNLITSCFECNSGKSDLILSMKLLL